jgi:hypothetical protein
LRYEDITRDTDGIIKKLGEFCGVAPKSGRPPSFKELHGLYPDFFRAGNDDANIAELQLNLPRFLELHGPLMRRLGYLPSVVARDCSFVSQLIGPNPAPALRRPAQGRG